MGEANRPSMKWPDGSAAPAVTSSSTRPTPATTSTNAPTSTAADRPRSDYRAKSANRIAYIAVRLAPSQASPFWAAHAIDR